MWGHGLVVALAVLEEWLDSLLESFSHLADSVVLVPHPLQAQQDTAKQVPVVSIPE